MTPGLAPDRFARMDMGALSKPRSTTRSSIAFRIASRLSGLPVMLRRFSGNRMFILLPRARRRALQIQSGFLVMLQKPRFEEFVLRSATKLAGSHLRNRNPKDE